MADSLQKLPEILLSYAQNITKFKFDVSQHVYKVNNSFNLSAIQELKSFKIDTFKKLSQSVLILITSLKNEQVIMKLDNNLELADKKQLKQQQLPFSSSFSVGTAVYKNHLLISLDGKLLILNQELDMIGEVSLEIPKNADNILVYQDKAFLLDNVVEPIFILQADLTQLEQPRILEKIELYGTNIHLKQQWLNPQLNHWYVIKTSATQEASTESILTFSMDKNIKEKSSQLIFHQSFSEESSLAASQDYQIIDITQLPPTWAIIQKEDDKKLYLTKMATKEFVSFNDVYPEGFIDFNETLELSSLFDYCSSEIGELVTYQNQGILKQYENKLFIILVITAVNKNWQITFQESKLLVVDVTDSPHIIINQPIDELKCDISSVSSLALELN